MSIEFFLQNPVAYESPESMEESTARSFGRLERVLKAHECDACLRSNGACIDLAVVLWNVVAVEIVKAIELEHLKSELLGVLCKIMTRKSAMDAVGVDPVETCDLIKAIARKITQDYFTECSRFYVDLEELKSAQQPYLSLMDNVATKMDLAFSSEVAAGLEHFIEPMTCPLARLFLERDCSSHELRTAVLLFQYYIRHLEKPTCNYETELGRLVLNFLQRENYKDEMFRLLYSDVVDLVVIMAEFGKEVFKGEKFYMDKFFKGRVQHVFSAKYIPFSNS